MRVYPDLTHALLLALVVYDPGTGTWMCWAKVEQVYGTGTWVYKATVIYDQETGKWTPQPEPLHGNIHEKPYEKDGKTVVYRHRMIHVNGKLYRASHLAYFYMTGKLPPKGYEIDHINNDSLDDRWENLRLATRSQQNMNKRGWAKSGLKGVHYHKASGLHRAIIEINGKQKTKYFKTKEEAHIAYGKMAKETWGEFANVVSMPASMKYDIPIKSDAHAQFCKQEAVRRYGVRLIKDHLGMWLVEDENGLCHTDDVLRALSRRDWETEDAV